jgi:hypothetical protein
MALLGWPVTLKKVVNDASRGPLAEFPMDQILDRWQVAADSFAQVPSRRFVAADNGGLNSECDGRRHG